MNPYAFTLNILSSDHLQGDLGWLRAMLTMGATFDDSDDTVTGNLPAEVARRLDSALGAESFAAKRVREMLNTYIVAIDSGTLPGFSA